MAQMKSGQLKRGIPKLLRSPLKKHARHVGEIAWAWNSLYDRLFMIFWTLSKTEDHSIAHTLWHTIQNDGTQRQMMLSLATVVLPKKSRMLAQLKWLKECVEDLAPLRNDAVHTPINFASLGDGRSVEVPAAQSARRQAVERQRVRSIAELWRSVRDDLYVLALYAQAIALRLNHPDRFGPLPHRPRLRAIPTRGRSKRKTLPHRARARQQRPPLS